ncbi:hypothetical protein RHGRI_022057 [Rhododendron griersonianum]|uniref:Late embryogenesis abundant protein LEA-2 subgroup domain-containing protein n=1 Tax=Rhododendron griersonianum TaxID=479676 RepID=A0AAV6JME8_9ERIC|nr:hypothetical protein RHGRI_022057 [Rhododendron griersonianum]
MNAVLGIKNTNFGPYKYDSTTVYFYNDGIQVGSAIIPKSKASFQPTKKINVLVNLVSPTNLTWSSPMGMDIDGRLISLTIKSELGDATKPGCLATRSDCSSRESMAWILTEQLTVI